MAIDTTLPQSPGWWMGRLTKKMMIRQKRLMLLELYLRGNPPIGAGADQLRETYRAFQNKARSNFAELIVEAVRERMNVRGFRTSAESEDIGDSAAWDIWKANGLDIESIDVHEWMLGLGDAYVIVGMDGDQPLITGEDPRQVVTEHDPMRPQKVVAALKLFHDDVNDYDLAYLYLPGNVYVAGKPRRATSQQTTGPQFNANAWSWLNEDLQIVAETVNAASADFNDMVAQPLPSGFEDIVPVVRFANKHERGEFEGHMDLLDRINHMILQRMVIATFQAFRQRAIKGTLPDVDEQGNTIDYEKVFSADPGALWQIPAAVEMWESGIVDLSPILNSVKADVEHLAAVTRTPMHYLTPGESSQSAEGAALAKEGLIFKTVDRISRANVGWTNVMHLAFLFMGDEERSNLSSLQPIWAPAQRYSLTEMASAAAQAATTLPTETIQELVWQLSPEELARAKTQRQADVIFQQQMAALVPKAAPAPAPTIVEPPAVES